MAYSRPNSANDGLTQSKSLNRNSHTFIFIKPQECTRLTSIWPQRTSEPPTVWAEPWSYDSNAEMARNSACALYFFVILSRRIANQFNA